MKSSRFHNILTLALVMLATMCVSCRQELCYDHYPAMDLRFRWEQEWERDYGMNHQTTWDALTHHYEYDELRPSEPEWVKMIKYFDDGHRSERFFTPRGDKFEVGEDEDCSLLFYNGDTEYIILSDIASIHDVRATATLRSRSGSPALQAMEELYQVTRTTNPPDVLYAAFVENVPGVKVHEVMDMPVRMQPLVYTYLISFEFEHGVEHVALARGALGGMAEGVYLRTGTTTDETAIILFDCSIHPDGCRSQVRSFGVPGFPDSYFGRTVSAGRARTPYSLSLEVKLKSGKTLDFSFDITDQVRNQPRGGVIKVGGIRIEDEENQQTSAGFDVGVSSWNDNVENVDLTLDP